MTTERIANFFRERIVFAKLATIILWVSYAISLILGNPAIPSNLKGEVAAADHLAWYTAARLIREGQPEKVYDHDFVKEYQAKLFPPDQWTTLMAYRNPPFYALLYWPTSSLPFVYSTLIWTLIHIGLLWCGVRWVAEDPRSPYTTFFWVFSLYPMFCAISYGQNTILSFAIFAGTYRLLANGRSFTAGMVAGLLLFKPQLLLGLVVWGVLDIRRKWPCLLGVIATGALLIGGSYPLVPEVWQGFLVSLKSNVKFDNFEQWKMHNPLAFWRLLMPHATSWHWPLAGVCSLIAVGGFVQLWRKRKQDLHVMFGGVVFLTLWASPHAMIYEWGLLALTGLLWLPERKRNPNAWFLLYGAAWVVTFLSSHFAELQLTLQGLDPASRDGLAVQLSIPVLAIVGWRAIGLLSPVRLDVSENCGRISGPGC